MFTKLKKVFAKVALTVLAMQLVTIALPVQTAHADATLTNPEITSVSYAGVTGTPDGSNLISMDVSHSKTGFDTATVVTTKASHLHVSFLGNPLFDKDLVLGNNPVDLSSYSLSLPVLQPIGGALGTINLDASVTDPTNTELETDYTISLNVVDKSNPVINSFGFAGNVATISQNVVSMPLYNVGDAELLSEKAAINVSRDSDLTVTSPSLLAPVTLFAGANNLTVNQMFGSNVTYSDLKSFDALDGVTDGVITSNATLSTTVSGMTFQTLYQFKLKLDTVAPVVTYSLKPATLNSVKKELNLIISADKPVTIDSATLTYKVDGVAVVPATLPTIDATTDFMKFGQVHTLTYPADFFLNAKKEINVTFTATDKAGNQTVTTAVVPVKNDAPVAVTNLVATVDAEKHVVLSWTNPPADSYTGLKVTRDGVFLTTLGVGTTTFTDVNVVPGQSYSYVVTAYDAADNETSTPALQVTVPSNEVAAAVSDSSTPTTDSKDTSTQGTVAAAEKKAATTKEDDKDFPWWGILILVILAGVGGWLIYSQKPAPVVAPVVPPVTAGTKKKPVSKNTKTKK